MATDAHYRGIGGADKLKITTYACGCVATESLNWNHAKDVEVASPGRCYHCDVIKDRPEIGSRTKFLRFGLPPASGRSRNHRDDFEEAGVSVYAIAGGKAVGAWGAIFFRDRPAYRGEGIVVGHGSDDEVLVEVTSIRRIGTKEAARLLGDG